MAILDLVRRALGGSVARAPRAEAGQNGEGYSLTDVRLAEMLKFGRLTASGFHVSPERALKNPSMLRAVSLISNSIGMLPLAMIDKETKLKASAHPLYRVLHRRPNASQSAYDFRSFVQLSALIKGDGYAQIIRSRDVRSGKPSIIELRPLDADRVEAKLNPDWTVAYAYQPLQGGRVILPSRDVFHLRGLSLDGVHGISVVRQASEAIGLALSAELAAGRQFKNGTFAGGALTHPGKLSDPAHKRLKESLAEKEGADNAGKNFVLEEGMKYEPLAQTARNAQLIDIMKIAIEEIGRATGVPRPLLMVDETSWGSGIEALGGFFVQYALSPWFEAWQQAGERSLLTEDEADQYEIKFNAGALLRGSLKDQADFFSKALGSGGAPGWMSQNDVRDITDMPRIEGGDEVSKGVMGAAAPADEGKTNAPKQAA